MYISGLGSRSTPLCFTSLTTPTISSHRNGLLRPPIFTRFPSGASPGKKTFVKVSLTTVT